MALVMGGIGIALVIARGRLDRVDTRSNLGRFGAAVPLVASVLVFGLGIYLTVQAVSGDARPVEPAAWPTATRYSPVITNEPARPAMPSGHPWRLVPNSVYNRSPSMTTRPHVNPVGSDPMRSWPGWLPT